MKRAPYQRKRRHRLPPFAVRLCLLVVLVIALIPLVAPVIVNLCIAPRILERHGLSITLRRLDYSGLETAVAIQDNASPWLKADSIRVRYTLRSLLRRRLEQVTVHGATLHVEQTDAGWRLKGMQPRPRRQGAKEMPLPKLRVGRISMHGARVRVEGRSGTHVITCEVTAHHVRLDRGFADARIEFSACSQDTVLTTDLILALRGSQVSVRAVPGKSSESQLITGRFQDAPLRMSIPDWEMRVVSDTATDSLSCSAQVVTRIDVAGKTTNDSGARFLTQLELSGTPKGVSGNLVSESTGLNTETFTCGPLRFSLPIIWPIPGTGLQGRVHIDCATLGDLTAGPSHLDVTGDLNGLSITGQCALGLHTAGVVSISGMMDMTGGDPEGELFLSLPVGNDSSALKMKHLYPAAPVADVRGKITTRFTSTNDMLDVQVQLSELNLERPALKAEGVDTHCRFDPRRAPASLPSQSLAVQHLALGSLSLHALNALYRIEHDRSVTVENAHARWCGGGLDMRGVTLRPNAEALDLLLHVDRIQVNELFQQLGLPKASGDSSLSGRIPLRLERGRLRFTDGFLSTRPGRSGVVSFGDVDAIAAALAQGAGQDLALVGAALKAFAYEWITLTLNSKGDKLTVQMSLSGRPEKRIRYRYENKTGSYVVTSRKEEWSQPEMEIDLNFHIPLDTIMKVTSETTRRFESGF